MSFFAKIFGGSDKKPEEKPAPKKQDSDIDKKIQRQRARANIQKQLKQFDDKERKLQAKVDTLKEKAKELVAEKKQKEARKYLGEVARINKQIQAVLVHKKAVLENVAQLEAADMTAETTKILQETKKHLDEHQKNSEKLLDLIEEANIRKRQQQEIHERMKALVQNDQQKQAQDEMLEQIMRQMERQKKKEQKVIAEKQVSIKVPQQKNQPIKQRDEIQDMLNAL